MKTKESLALMGKVVTVLAEFHRDSSSFAMGSKREWKRKILKTSRAGWVMGIRTLQNGTLDGGYHDEQPYLRVNDTVRCVLVVYWPTMNPVKVPLDAFKEGGEPKPPSAHWSEADRAALRKTMADEPRDERGRWK